MYSYHLTKMNITNLKILMVKHCLKTIIAIILQKIELSLPFNTDFKNFCNLGHRKYVLNKNKLFKQALK